MNENEQIKRINALVDNALSGNFEAEDDIATYAPEFTQLRKAIGLLIEKQMNFEAETQVTASRITSASEDMSLTLGETSNFMRELAAQAEKTNKLNDMNHLSTVNVMNNVKDIVANTDKIRAFSGDARAAGVKASAAVNDTMEHVYEIIGLIGTIGESTKRTAEYVDKFGESIKKISDILKVVHDISRETEILSFNASIESKRAGTAGRGFGVIAEAIRNLSEKSRDEVAEISGTVEEINRGLETLTENIHEDNGSAEKSVEKTQTVKDSLSHMRETFSLLTDRINGILTASQDQDKLTSEISGKINDVENNSQLVSDNFSKMSSAIKKQKSGMDSLDALGKYLLSSANEMSGIIHSAGIIKADPEIVESLSEEVFELLSGSVLSVPQFLSLDPAAHKSVLDTVVSRNEKVEAAWSNDLNGRFVYSNPPAGIKNAKVRGWFRESIKGKNFVSEVYISAITKKPCVTVSMPILKGGNLVGVVGVDLRLR